MPPQTLTPSKLRQQFPEFFGTMAYHYMNGPLHPSGHTICGRTVTKVAEILGSDWEGFHQGIKNYGAFKGEIVQVIQAKVQQQLLDSGEAFQYTEPDKREISRSGDECGVALMDQWYLDYGETFWKNTTLEFVENSEAFNIYVQETRNGLRGVLNWLDQWACTRTYGLGYKVPWDSQFLVESLSDSTQYMAYYTVAHKLTDIYGQAPGTLKIPNHLTFFIYIYLAIFLLEYWPKAIRENGHLLLNDQKSTRKYGEDATQITLADAGDGVNNTNFNEQVADATILRLHALREWCEEQVKANPKPNPSPSAGLTLFDKTFANYMNVLAAECCRHYADTNKLQTRSEGGAYLEWQALLLAVIAPPGRSSEVLGRRGTIHNATFPVPRANDPALTVQGEYIRSTTSRITSALAAYEKKAKRKSLDFDPKKPSALNIHTASTFPAWQDDSIDILHECFDGDNQLIDNDSLTRQVLALSEATKAMPFVQTLKKRFLSGEQPDSNFERKLVFDEVLSRGQALSVLKSATGLVRIDIIEGVLWRYQGSQP
ncbi:uncharacterized protein BDW43DRAFT_316695 [Aspergillus alliaceus]|uniref:uncharacterized protein n=1 Tax=Petromyces alliaceus TaxID=209559 RepID=UPI0012A5373B|nr:uncharacterized protein BDW43DRAFT_316695 [Aspergillus alliaceus]KAB8227579.1 hypothetical protein BDW43DRAFT_316695 [Aspergillus alliaceus]